MSSRNSSRKRFAEWSAAAKPVPASAVPRLPESSPRPAGRKALQLCRQVSRTLGYAFAACGDRVLNDLFVESVEPAPDDTRLLVTVRSSDPGKSSAEILTHLYQASGHLRAEIAADIHRKKVPELSFHCIVEGAS